MTTIATLCTGFDGVGVGGCAAGLELAWGIELDPRIAAVANANLGNHVRVANILDCDPLKFDAPDILHASPPCTNASLANAKGGETELDKALARKAAEFIKTLRPRIFTLENVWQYRHFRAWQIIEDALWNNGYWVSVEHCNAANFGVPQTRKRMIVRAVRDGFVPYLPSPVQWVGWYSAIKDIVDTLPESQFAPWQMARLPELLSTLLIAQSGYGGALTTVDSNEPSFSVTANHNQLGIKAFLMQVQGEGGAVPKAWLVDGQNASGNITVRDGESPAFTITNQDKGLSRALIECGRVVSMTPRALARFQTFPDWYALPDNARLAAKGIGNAVPPLLYQRIIEQLLRSLS